jgi:protein-disulfide isomerase
MLGFRRLTWTVLALTVLTACSSTPRTPTTPITAVLDPATATVLAGKADAKSTVEVYEDFLCPFCATFERTTADQVNDQLGKGTIKVRYHLLNLLDANSVPAGYSTLAANAALTVAQLAPDKFMAFHTLLFSQQPEEGKSGYTEHQLIDFAKQAGVTDPGLATAVKAKSFDSRITANLAAAAKDPSLKQSASDGSQVFGTPAVLVNGKLANWRSDQWLTAS